MKPILAMASKLPAVASSSTPRRRNTPRTTSATGIGPVSEAARATKGKQHRQKPPNSAPRRETANCAIAARPPMLPVIHHDRLLVHEVLEHRLQARFLAEPRMLH